MACTSSLRDAGTRSANLLCLPPAKGREVDVCVCVMLSYCLACLRLSIRICIRVVQSFINVVLAT